MAETSKIQNRLLTEHETFTPKAALFTIAMMLRYPDVLTGEIVSFNARLNQKPGRELRSDNSIGVADKVVRAVFHLEWRRDHEAELKERLTKRGDEVEQKEIFSENEKIGIILNKCGIS